MNRVLKFFLLSLAFLIVLKEAQAEEESIKAVPYTVRFEGYANKTQLAMLEKISKLVTLKDKLPETIYGIKKRAEEDLSHLKQTLEADGYYQSKVSYKLQENEEVQVLIKILLGPRYQLKDVIIKSNHPVPLLESLQKEIAEHHKFLNTDLDKPAVAETIKRIEATLLNTLENNGYPFVTLKDRYIIVNYLNQSMSVTFEVEPGPYCTFGKVTLEGLKTIEPSFILAKINWREGETYSENKVKEVTEAIKATGLFFSVLFEHKEKPLSNSKLPLKLELKEGKHREIGAGVHYTTSQGKAFQGAATKVYWKHHNLFGEAENLETALTLSPLSTHLTTDFTKPDFLKPHQNLSLNVAAKRDYFKAYKRKGIFGAAQIDRPLFEYTRGGIGLSGEQAEIFKEGKTSRSRLIGTPLSISRDTTNDKLNPTEGNVFGLFLTPYSKVIGSNINLTRITANEMCLLPLTKNKEHILAGWIEAGTLLKNSRSEVPADKLFYGGGSGSIRGYSYQIIGPLDINNKPLGGLSLLEFGMELRNKITNKWGVVTFLEGGNIYPERIPKVSGKKFWGAGVGLRYYTSVGPIRFDLAFPLNRRHNIDSPFQIYVSLGQAF